MSTWRGRRRRGAAESSRNRMLRRAIASILGACTGGTRAKKRPVKSVYQNTITRNETVSSYCPERGPRSRLRSSLVGSRARCIAYIITLLCLAVGRIRSCCAPSCPSGFTPSWVRPFLYSAVSFFLIVSFFHASIVFTFVTQTSCFTQKVASFVGHSSLSSKSSR